MDSSAAGYNQSSFQGMSNMGAQFEAQRMRSSAMLEYEEPDMKRKDMDDDVNEGLGTSGGLSKFGKGAKDFYSKYQEIKGKAQKVQQAASDAKDALAAAARPNAPGSSTQEPLKGSGGDRLQDPGANIQPGSQEETYAKLAQKSVNEGHATTVGNMDDVTAAQTKALIKQDPIASQNPMASGNSIEDTNKILNARSDIIDSKVSNVQDAGKTTNNGVRAVDNTIDDLGGDLIDPAQRVQAAGSYVKSAMSKLFGGAGNTADAGGQIAGSVRQAANNGLGAARGAMANAANNVHATVQGAQSTLSGATDDAANMAGKAISTGTKVMDGVDDAVSMGSKVLTGASTVLDALGPIGDLLGLGMAIFGGVEAHHQEKIEAAAQSKAEGAMAAPTSSMTAANTAMTTGTLDTSHPGQAVAAAHF